MLLDKKPAPAPGPARSGLLGCWGFFCCCFGSGRSAFGFFRCQSSQTTCKARNRSQHNAQQLREQNFTARNARQRSNSSFIQLFACEVTGSDDQFVVGFSEVVDDFSCCNGIVRDRVDQWTGHAVCQGGKLRAFNCATSEGVFQHSQVHALSARFGTELRQVSNLDATILGHDDGLRSCYFCGNFGDDGLFVIQIETHGQSP